MKSDQCISRLCTCHCFPGQLGLLKPKPHLVHVVQHVLKPTAIQNSTFALLSLIGLTRKLSKDIERLETSRVFLAFLALQLLIVGLAPWIQYFFFDAALSGSPRPA